MTIDARTIEFDAQLLTSHGCSRGVIRVDPNDTDEDLRINTTCESANILHIKRLGKTDYTLVTFDASHPPKIGTEDSKATNNTAPPDLANNIAFPSLESKIKPTAPVQGRIQPVCETEVMIESSTEMSEQSAASTSTTASRKQVSRPNRLPRRSRQPHMPDSINILGQEIASQRRHLQSLQKQLQKQLDLALADEKMENEDQTSQSLQECSPSRTQTPHCAAASGFPCIDLPMLAEAQIERVVMSVKKRVPERSESEIRRCVDELRLTRGGYSRMTLGEIVDEVLEHIKGGE
ncbi:hypothetical protein HPB48_019832 [Haemaphysalis longicornis]|uniref:Uncharacterized protein n=1 Tax=Haemaphysalis longicornis TaxID=44386 RepID=A0A9J6FB74_HAELO|nr:hypothetical protein HPB48_019832 [Haemaphysalis longicornis]